MIFVHLAPGFFCEVVFLKALGGGRGSLSYGKLQYGILQD